MKKSSLNQKKKHNLLQKAQRIIDQIYPQADAKQDEEMYSFRDEALKQLKQLRDTAWTLEEETSLREFIKSLREIESERDKQVTKKSKEAVSNENWIGSNVRLGKKAAFKVEANITGKSIINKYYLPLEEGINKENVKNRRPLRWLAFSLMIAAVLYHLYVWLSQFFRRNSLSDILKRRYQQPDFAQLKRLFSEEYMLINTSFINLALVTHEVYQQQKEFDSQSHLSKPMEDQPWFPLQQQKQLYQKKLIDLNMIFMSNEEGKPAPRHVLVEGGAGMGKTTLSRYLVYQWALGEQSALPHLAKRFSAVIWLSLPALVEMIKTNYSAPKALSTYKLVAEFIYQHTFFEPWQADYSVTEIEAWLDTLEQTNQVLYVFDGYDQIASWSLDPSWESFFEKLWRKPDWLITSRPYSFSMRHEEEARHLELLGFVDKDIPLYVEHFFVKEENNYAKDLIEKLENNISLWNVAHTPINLELLCIIWQEYMLGFQQGLFNKNNRVTLTMLYEQLLSFLFRRAIQTQVLESTLLTQLISVPPLHDEIEQQHPSVPVLLGVLEKLAWRSVDQEIDIFKSEDFKPLLAEAFQPNQYWELTTGECLAKIVFQQIGLLRAIGKRDELIIHQDHEFLHPTFTEFLAARYLVKCILTDEPILIWKDRTAKAQKKMFIDFMRERRYERRYYLLLSFTAGLLKMHGDSINDYTGLTNFFAALRQPMQKDLIGWNDLMLQLYCLEECEMPSKEILPSVELIKETLIQWVDKFISETAVNPELRQQLMKQLKAMPLANRLIVVPRLMQLLERKENLTNEKILWTLVEELCELNVELDNATTIAIFSNLNIEEHEQKIIMKSLQRPDILDLQYVVPALFILLYDPGIFNNDHRQIFIWMLKQLAKTEATSFIPIAVSFLANSADDWQYISYLSSESAFEEASKQLGDFIGTDRVMVLELLGQHTDEKSLRVIVKTLRTFNIMDSERIVSMLLDLLAQTTNTKFQKTIVEVLEELGKTKANRIIPVLLDLLVQITDVGIQKAVVKTLGQLGRKKVMYWFGGTYQFDENIMHLDGAVETERIVSVLLDLLTQTTHVGIQKSIVEVLGELDRTKANRIIPVLLDLLARTIDVEMQCTIVRTLGQLGWDEANRIIAVLLDLLARTTDVEIQCAIIRTLGQLGWDEVNRIIPVLLDLMTHAENVEILRTTIETVGSLSANDWGWRDSTRILNIWGWKVRILRSNVIEVVPIVSVLLDLLTNVTDVPTQRYIVKMLGRLGTKEAERIISVLLLELLTHTTDVRTQKTIVETLGQLGAAEAERIIPVLLDLLTYTTDVGTQMTIVETLGQLGAAEAERIIPVLLDLLTYISDVETQRTIVETLGQLGAAEAERIIPVLLDLLTHTRDIWLMESITKSLKQLNATEANGIISILLDLILQDDDFDAAKTESTIIEMLEELGIRGTDCITSALLDLLARTSDFWLQTTIIERFGQWSAVEAERIAPVLLNLHASTTNLLASNTIKEALKQLRTVAADRITPKLLELRAQDIADEVIRQTLLKAREQLSATDVDHNVDVLLNLLSTTIDEGTRSSVTYVLINFYTDSYRNEIIVTKSFNLLTVMQEELAMLKEGALNSSDNDATLIVENRIKYIFNVHRCIIDLLQKLEAAADDTLYLLISNMHRLYLLNKDENMNYVIVDWLFQVGFLTDIHKLISKVFADIFIKTESQKMQYKIADYIVTIYKSQADKTILQNFLQPQQAERFLSFGELYDSWLDSLLSTALLLEIYQQTPHPVYLSLVMQTCLKENQALTIVAQENYVEVQIYSYNKHVWRYHLENADISHFAEAKNAAAFLTTDLMVISPQPIPLPSPVTQIETEQEVGITCQPDAEVIVEKEICKAKSGCETESSEVINYPMEFPNLLHTRKPLSYEEHEAVTATASQLHPFWLTQKLFSSLLWSYQKIMLLLQDNASFCSANIVYHPLPQATFNEQLCLLYYLGGQFQQSHFGFSIKAVVNKLLQTLPYYYPHTLSIKEHALLQSNLQTTYKLINQLKHYQSTRVGRSLTYQEEILPVLASVHELADFITTLLKNERASLAEITQITHKTQVLQQTIAQLDIKNLNKTLRYAEIKQARLERRSMKTGQSSTTKLLVCLNKHAGNKWTIRKQTMDEKLNELWIDKSPSSLASDKTAIRSITIRAEQRSDRLQQVSLNDDTHFEISQKTL